MWEFHGGPGVRTWHFHCCGQGSIPGWGTKIPQAAWQGQQKKVAESRHSCPVLHLRENAFSFSLLSHFLFSCIALYFHFTLFSSWIFHNSLFISDMILPFCSFFSLNSIDLYFSLFSCLLLFIVFLTQKYLFFNIPKCLVNDNSFSLECCVMVYIFWLFGFSVLPST